jgi:hypothetical protein
VVHGKRTPGYRLHRKKLKILEDGEKRRNSKWIAGFQNERSMEDKGEKDMIRGKNILKFQKI